ncbi:MAG: 4a-hydroxytetrahydrobiopterin dehydratase [Frankiaceae bacterium]|nr:4a-hydroxytetrahydrobiopterin dehydratase [Frankiaceae bacterium]MBV9872957.1 4a-hydroxytetrahydrobiopterin dehydratase [Frankiaceae bacterium]
MATVLDDAARDAALGELTGWAGDRSAIRRTVHVDGGPQAMDDVLAKLEVIAREMDHDPDTEITDGDLTIVMSTHSAGGVTELDIEYARRVDALLG